MPAQSEKTDETGLLMLQWRSIADSVRVRSPQDASGRIILVVEAEKDRSLIENAFLESFGKTDLRLIVTGEHVSADAKVLRISGIVRLEAPASEVTCDARWEEADGAQYLGRFRSSPGEFSRDGSSGATALERFIEPLVVISGAILIVYLFFTVRS